MKFACSNQRGLWLPQATILEGRVAATAQTPYRELARQLRAVNVVNRELARSLPQDCPPASVGLLTLLYKYGEMRMSRLTELLGIDMSVTSRHVAHAADRGWIERKPDPDDGRSRLLHLTAHGEQQLHELSDLATASLSEHLADWPEEDVVCLTDLLGRLRGSYARPGPADPAAPAHSPTPHS
jgi:DNA-binding MarR family transcriptional regulator